jgi:hypothetical protein
MNQPGDKPASLEARLLSKPPRTAGLDSHGQPVRFGERDRDGLPVGYTDEQGLPGNPSRNSQQRRAPHRWRGRSPSRTTTPIATN